MLVNNKPVRFIHIPKNAGSSIEKFRRRNSIDVKIGVEPKGGGKHRPAYAWLHENSFKFCTIRNPYSRTVSYYKYAKKKAKERENHTWNYTFEEFILDKDLEMSTPIPSPWIPQVWWMYMHTSPFMKSKSMHGSVDDQISLKFVDLSICMIDKIFKIEDQDFDQQIKDFFNTDKTFIHENISPGADDDVYYTPELKEIVYERLKIDFDMLGYEK